MKKLLCSLYITLTALNASWLSGQIVQQWTFDDAAGTELSAASNSGSGDFTFNDALDTRSVITGGVLEISGLNNEAATYPAFASGTAVTFSQLELSFDVPAFDLSGGDGGGANISVDFLDGFTVLGTLRLRKNGGEFKATLNSDNSIEQTLTSGGATNTNGVNVVMNIDLGTDTYSASLTGGSGITGAILGPVSFNAGATASQITQIRVRAASLQDTDWGASDYIQIDNLTLTNLDLTPVPEPATAILLTGFGVLGLAIFRRRTN